MEIIVPILQVSVFLSFYLHTLSGQTCLSNPPSISHSATNSNDTEWETISSGVYATTLTFDAKEFDKDEYNCKCTFQTRVHNEMFPSPTMIMRPGNQYQVTLINNLGPESPLNPTEMNEFKDPNTTSLHTHGLHISGESPGDSIFSTVYPNSQVTYIYNIPNYHASGTFWYHPHHHGSTTLQVGGGAAGALIVEQESDELYSSVEGMPEWLITMEELVIVIQWFHLRSISSLFEDESIDLVTGYTESRDCGTAVYYTLNGEYQPSICLVAGSWKRLRLINTAYEEPTTIYLTDSTTSGDGVSCELQLIARDGILLDNGPREVSHIWLAQAQRADVAILCQNSGTVQLDDGADEIYGYITVSTEDESGSSASSVELTAFTPIRPTEYITDLTDYSGEFQTYTTTNDNGMEVELDYFNVRVSGNAMNFVGFEGQGEFLASLESGSVNEWRISRGIAVLHHPFHMHIFPFQVVEDGFDGDVTGQDIPENWHQTGDYVDVMYGTGNIRFIAATFGGEVVLHCHILKHEDEGAMGVVEVKGGCDAEYGDYISPNDEDGEITEYPACDYNYNPNNPTSYPTITPTKQPTDQPTDEPTNQPTDQPTDEPTNRPTAQPTTQPSGHPTSKPTDNPTNRPTNTPTANPTIQPTDNPTNKPTEDPTGRPTNEPTNVPTFERTADKCCHYPDNTQSRLFETRCNGRSTESSCRAIACEWDSDSSDCVDSDVADSEYCQPGTCEPANRYSRSARLCSSYNQYPASCDESRMCKWNCQ